MQSWGVCVWECKEVAESSDSRHWMLSHWVAAVSHPLRRFGVTVRASCLSANEIDHSLGDLKMTLISSQPYYALQRMVYGWSLQASKSGVKVRWEGQLESESGVDQSPIDRDRLE